MCFDVEQGRDVGSCRKCLVLTIISSFYSDDGNNTINRGGRNKNESSEISEGTSGDNGAGSDVAEMGAFDDDFANQADPGMSWAQDTDHGYRFGIWEQRKALGNTNYIS